MVDICGYGCRKVGPLNLKPSIYLKYPKVFFLNIGESYIILERIRAHVDPMVIPGSPGTRTMSLCFALRAQSLVHAFLATDRNGEFQNIPDMGMMAEQNCIESYENVGGLNC